MSQNHSGLIIIGHGRIGVALASSGFEMIRAASQAASNLVTYYGDKLTFADTESIARLQHEMMDFASGTAAAPRRARASSADEMVDEMFAQLDALEDKLSS